MANQMELNVEILNLDSPAIDRKKIEFKEYLIESIEEILSFSQVVLNFMEINTAFKKEEIVDKPNVFSEELEDFFGASSKGIEDLILKRFYSKIKQKYRKEHGKDFGCYITDAFTCYMELY